MSIFAKFPDDTFFFSRYDSEQPLASYSKHEFELEGQQWPSVEHYFQAMKFASPQLQQRIREAAHPKLAAQIARRNFWKVRRDWKKIQRVIMTRATYTKCRTHPDVAAALLATGDRLIVEQSIYDHYWGCGRDLRGHNYFGKMLVDIRQRLREELAK